MDTSLMVVLVLSLCSGATLATMSKKPGNPHRERVVLVTGVAGFIGFHISKQLVHEWGVKQVVGLDSFNDYYDVQLKNDRASELLRIGVKVYRGDVCDAQLLHYLMLTYNFTDVVHMAAQAGVRYSLQDPQAYVSANYECFISLLDTLVEFPTYLVYASSSSVYGKRASIPFSSEEPLRAPGNLYAASKIMNEHLAASYCSQHGLLATGLRFFTVYGPWGRPDMAAYKFAESIVTGMPVPLFEAGAGQQLKRDFTYVEDIVSGVLSSMDYTPARCGEAYNLGYGQPLVVEDMLDYLQQELAMTAIVDRQPLPPSDMILTFADITTSKRVLSFSPKTSTAEGIHHFVVWFKEYYDNRIQWEKGGRHSSRNTLLEESLQERDREFAAYQAQQIATDNTQYQHRLAALRQKYTNYAKEENISLPKLEKKAFIRHEGRQSPGSTIIKALAYHGNTQMLEARCMATEQCIAFTSDGEFKNNVQPHQQWQDSTQDLYVADVDVCMADLHRCGTNSHCLSSGPGTYKCECVAGYQLLGKSCVERYKEGETSASEQQWKLCDLIDGVNWTALVEGKEFVFFPGLDSPGGDYLVVQEEAGHVCRQTDHCIAYNTNGILKHSLQAPQHWVQWTNDPKHGLYVRDIDYCHLGMEQCPTNSRCTRTSPANYSCQCVHPYQASKAGGCVLPSQQSEEISIVLSVDSHHLTGLVALLKSLWQHTSHVEQLQVYIVAVDMTSDVVLSFLACHHIETNQVEVLALASAAVSPLRRVVDSPDIVGNLASAANFARFQLPELFPQLKLALYLDIDTIVMGDVREVWHYLVISSKMIVAVPRPSVTYGGLFSKTVKQLFLKRYGKTYADTDPSFNAGLWGINFDLWRKQQMSEEVKYWTERHAEQALWRFGTQPILLLLAHNHWDHLPLEWNVDGLGWNTDIPSQKLHSAKLLHWSGKGKPWLSDGLYRELWTPYQPLECSGHGKCMEERDKVWTCKCDAGFSGLLCNG